MVVTRVLIASAPFIPSFCHDRRWCIPKMTSDAPVLALGFLMLLVSSSCVVAWTKGRATFYGNEPWCGGFIMQSGSLDPWTWHQCAHQLLSCNSKLPANMA